MYEEHRTAQKRLLVVGTVVAAVIALAGQHPAVTFAAAALTVLLGLAASRRNGVEVTQDEVVIHHPMSKAKRITHNSITDVVIVPRRGYTTEVMALPVGGSSVVVTYADGQQINIETAQPTTLKKAIDAAGGVR